MSDKKIIIRNCPAFDSKYNECHSKIEPHKLYCMDCTDCILKQIVELCKEDWEDITVSKFQSELLNNLDIQECEDD